MEREVAALHARLAAGPAEELPRLQWSVILPVAALGGLVAVPWLFGWRDSPLSSNLYWWVYPALAAWIVGTRTRYAFANGLASGALATVLQYVVLFAGWETYAANNARYLADMAAWYPEMHPSEYRGYIIQGMLEFLPTYGLMLGVLAWIARRVFRGQALPLSP